MSYLGTTKIGKMYLGSTEIAKAFLGTNLVFQKGGATPYSRLPEGYTELAYVENGANSQAYVKTGVIASNNTGFYIDALSNDALSSSGYGCLFGSRVSSNSSDFQLTTYTPAGNNWSGTLRRGTNSQNYNANLLDGTRFQAELSGTTYAILGTNYTTEAGITDGKEIYLFALNNNGEATQNGHFRVYRFKLFNGSTLVLNYIPARRDSDSVVGFYDLANNQFVTSEAGTTLTAGPNAVYSGNMLLTLHWDGSDSPSSSKWYDKISNQYYTLTNGTHGTDYFEFLNSNPASASAYGLLNGVLPDLGYHWKIVADIAIGTQANNPAGFSPIDFGSLGGVENDLCAVGFYLSNSNSKWTPNLKLDGNNSATVYGVDSGNRPEESSIPTTQTWIRRTITIGVRASSTTGRDESFISVSDIGTGVSTTPFPPIKCNRWKNAVNYLARSAINPDNSFKYATNTRIYSIKVYYQPDMQRTRFFAGRKIAIIGDSISTYNAQGYKYDSYSMYYPRLDVTNVNQTWWKRLIDDDGATLEVNLSYSGSRASTNSSMPTLYDRIGLIGSADTVIIALGTNDSNGNVDLGDYSYDADISSLDVSKFREAYIKGIKGLLTNNPNITIVCAILYMKWEYKNSIIEIANHYGLRCVDCSKYVMLEQVHPNALGMEQVEQPFLNI